MPAARRAGRDETAHHSTVIGAVSVTEYPLSPVHWNVDRAAVGRNGVECDVGIGRDRWEQIGAKDFLAVIAANELRDDIARDKLADVRLCEIRFPSRAKSMS